MPTYAWASIQGIQRQIDLARRRGWHGAAKRLTDDLVDAVANCHRQLETSLRGLEAAKRRPRHLVSAGDICRNLTALKNEFEALDIDLKAHELSVTTDTIALDDVLLGSFEIRLDWDDIGRIHQPYRVIALDPHPAAKSDEITHPHVQNESLCEGEGRLAIAAALAEGRLYDLFLLVSQVLHTYGQGSAYVELDHWDGIPCDDCGASLSDDDQYYCQSCDSTLCDSCSLCCCGCDNSFCASCLHQCVVCDQEYCSGCLETCPVCRKRFCNDCCKDKMCMTCYEKLHPKDSQDDVSDDSECEAACLAG